MHSINKILVIRLSSIGDIMLTTPLLRHVARAFPDARIDYCTKPPFLSLLATNPRISSIYTTDNLPSNGYDLVVDLQNNFRSHAITRSLQSDRTVRYQKENWKKWLLVHLKLNLYGCYRSVVDRYLNSLKPFEISADQQGCELYLSSEEMAYAESYIGAGMKSLALCFGAKHFTKCFPAQKFASLIALLLEKEPLQIVLLGAEEDASAADEIMDRLLPFCRPMVLNFAGKCTLMQTAALLARCDATLSNDTGLMHIASAFSKKLFVLFGSSSSAFGFLPYHTPHELFEVDGLRCKPCSHIGRDYCPKGHFRCMNALSEVTIAERIIEYLRDIPFSS